MSLSASDRRRKAVWKGFVSGGGSGAWRVSHFSKRVPCVSASFAFPLKPVPPSHGVFVCLCSVLVRISVRVWCASMSQHSYMGYIHPDYSPVSSFHNNSFFLSVFFFLFLSPAWTKLDLTCRFCSIPCFNVFLRLWTYMESRSVHIHIHVETFCSKCEVTNVSSSVVHSKLYYKFLGLLILLFLLTSIMHFGSHEIPAEITPLSLKLRSPW